MEKTEIINKLKTKYILSKDFKFLETGNTGSALFKRNNHYLTIYKDWKVTVINNKSEYMFQGYVETEEEFDCLIKMLRLC